MTVSIFMFKKLSLPGAYKSKPKEQIKKAIKIPNPKPINKQPPFRALNEKLEKPGN